MLSEKKSFGAYVDHCIEASRGTGSRIHVFLNGYKGFCTKVSHEVWIPEAYSFTVVTLFLVWYCKVLAQTQTQTHAHTQVLSHN